MQKRFYRFPVRLIAVTAGAGIAGTPVPGPMDRTWYSLPGRGSHDLKTMEKVLNVKIAHMRG
jgi:hypothetical protein